jgi:ferritin-like metal-binding protein YciE
MGLFSSMKFDNFEDLLVEQLQDLYDAEHQLTKALPKMAEAADNSELRQAFDDHLQETERQIQRLEEVFRLIGRDAKRKTCEAMKGLVEEGSEVIDAEGDPSVRDAALIASAQRVEHYEIAGYGSARNFAQRLGHVQAAELLQETLNEEGACDHRLTAIAESSVNASAQRA